MMSQHPRFAAIVGLALSFACGGGSDRPPPPPPPPPPAVSPTVTGLALDIRGQPFAGAQVRIGALAPATTNADGRFSVDAGPQTYDAAVVAQIPATQFSPAQSVAVVYTGLTRRDPTLWLPVEQLPGTFFGASSYSVSGIPSPGCTLYVLIDSHGNRFSQRNLFNRTCSGGPLSVMPWYGPASSTGSLVALSLGGSPAIAASGHIAVNANDGGGPDVTVPVAAVEPFAIQGTTAIPPDCFLQQADVIVPRLHSDPASVVASNFARIGAFTLNLGWTAEAPLSMVTRAQCGTSGDSVAAAIRRIRRETTSYALAVPPPPVLTAPAATNTAAPFSWTAPAASLGLLRFLHIDPNGSITAVVFVVTSASSASFPDLSGLTGAPPANLGYQTSVENWDGLHSTDAAAASDGLAALVSGLVDSNYGASTSGLNLLP